MKCQAVGGGREAAPYKSRVLTSNDLDLVMTWTSSSNDLDLVMTWT